MSELDFEEPLWSATIYHSEPGATNPWNRAFNSQVTEDQRADHKKALAKAVAMFVGDNLKEITIYRIEIAPLMQFGEEGEHAD